MRKNRNTFFTESNMNYTNFQNHEVMPNPNIPFQPQINYNPYQGQNPYIDTSNNIENRLAKMERQINRLERRINKLESVNTTFLDNDIDTTTNNMYML
ncbi:hypothetical protein EGR52_07970 [bacterium]|nr:hypothetical protein [bacterium]